MSVLVRVDELAAELERDAPVRLLDVRWRLDQPEGRPAYLAGHLPGAVYVDLERELARPGRPDEGRHPLPTAIDLTVALRRWGVNDGDQVVVYDDNDGVPAARAWWLLRRLDIDVRVLDGGFRAWVQSGGRLEHSDRAVRSGTLSVADPGNRGVADIDQTALAPRVGVLVDVRAPQHYRGVASGLDPATGHIPGAVNIPTVSHIGPDGLLRGADEIRATLTAHGIHAETAVVLYCSSGIPSTHSALAFAIAGVDTRIFPGSWSQWARSPGRPVAVGAEPAGLIGVV